MPARYMRPLVAAEDDDDEGSSLGVFNNARVSSTVSTRGHVAHTGPPIEPSRKRRKSIGLNTRFDRMLESIPYLPGVPQTPQRQRGRARSNGSSSVSSYGAPRTPMDAYTQLSGGNLGAGFSVLKMDRVTTSALASKHGGRSHDQAVRLFHQDLGESSSSPPPVYAVRPEEPLPDWMAKTLSTLAPRHPLRVLLPPSRSGMDLYASVLNPRKSFDKLTSFSARDVCSNNDGPVFAFSPPRKPISPTHFPRELFERESESHPGAAMDVENPVSVPLPQQMLNPHYSYPTAGNHNLSVSDPRLRVHSRSAVDFSSHIMHYQEPLHETATPPLRQSEEEEDNMGASVSVPIFSPMLNSRPIHSAAGQHSQIVSDPKLRVRKLSTADFSSRPVSCRESLHEVSAPQQSDEKQNDLRSHWTGVQPVQLAVMPHGISASVPCPQDEEQAHSKSDWNDADPPIRATGLPFSTPGPFVSVMHPQSCSGAPSVSVETVQAAQQAPTWTTLDAASAVTPPSIFARAPSHEIPNIIFETYVPPLIDTITPESEASDVVETHPPDTASVLWNPFSTPGPTHAYSHTLEDSSITAGAGDDPGAASHSDGPIANNSSSDPPQPEPVEYTVGYDHEALDFRWEPFFRAERGTEHGPRQDADDDGSGYVRIGSGDINVDGGFNGNDAVESSFNPDDLAGSGICVDTNDIGFSDARPDAYAEIIAMDHKDNIPHSSVNTQHEHDDAFEDIDELDEQTLTASVRAQELDHDFQSLAHEPILPPRPAFAPAPDIFLSPLSQMQEQEFVDAAHDKNAQENSATNEDDDQGGKEAIMVPQAASPNNTPHTTKSTPLPHPQRSQHPQPPPLTPKKKRAVFTLAPTVPPAFGFSTPRRVSWRGTVTPRRDMGASTAARESFVAQTKKREVDVEGKVDGRVGSQNSNDSIESWGNMPP